jgi:AraC family transcriptional activator of pobA
LLPRAAVRPNESRDKATSEVLELVKEFMEKQPGYEFNIKMRLALIISHLCREAGDLEVVPRRPEGGSRSVDPEFTALFKYVEEHYADKITLEKAARLVSLSVHHFCKKFKKLTGRTFVEYVNLY